METSGNLNRKLQLSLEPKTLNWSLSGTTVTENMFLQAEVQSREAKGYILDLGFKDGASGFLKFPDGISEQDKHEVGERVHVIVQSSTSKKVIKCEYASAQNVAESLVKTKNQQDSDGKVTIHTLKPGFLVEGKVTKLFDNGLEMSFLAGLTGTVFTDHLKRKHKYKVNEKGPKWSRIFEGLLP